MKNIFAIILLTLLLSLPSVADEQGDLQAEAERHLLLTEAQWAFDESMKNAKDYIYQTINQQKADSGAELTALEEKHTQELISLMSNELSWGNMEPAIINLLTTIYSLDELKAINAFYDSEVGRKMVAKTPELSKQQMLMMQNLMQGFQEKMKVLMAQQADERKAQSDN